MIVGAVIVAVIGIAALACIGLGGYLHYRYGSKVKSAGEAVVQAVQSELSK